MLQRIHQPVRTKQICLPPLIHVIPFFSSERTEIDKAAATRFIKHAIAQAQWKKTAAEADDDEDDNNVTSDNTVTHQAVPSSSSHIPVKMTSKMVQRAAYEKDIKEQDAMDSDEDELEVFEGDELPTRTESKQDIKGKGKRKESTPPAIIDEDTHISLNKRRRPVVDPFAGTFDSPSIWYFVIDYDNIQDTAMTLHHPIVLQPKNPQIWILKFQLTCRHLQTVKNDLNQRKKRRTRNVYIAKVVHSTSIHLYTIHCYDQISETRATTKNKSTKFTKGQMSFIVWHCGKLVEEAAKKVHWGGGDGDKLVSWIRK
jgi:hypothetical protein